MIRVRLAAIEADQRSSRFFSRIPERSLNCSTRLLRFRTGTGVVKPPHRLTCRSGCAILSKRKLESSASTPSGPSSVTLNVPITGQDLGADSLEVAGQYQFCHCGTRTERCSTIDFGRSVQLLMIFILYINYI
jgi:hypothetical protein